MPLFSPELEELFLLGVRIEEIYRALLLTLCQRESRTVDCFGLFGC